VVTAKGHSRTQSVNSKNSDIGKSRSLSRSIKTAKISKKDQKPKSQKTIPSRPVSPKPLIPEGDPLQKKNEQRSKSITKISQLANPRYLFTSPKVDTGLRPKSPEIAQNSKKISISKIPNPNFSAQVKHQKELCASQVYSSKNSKNQTPSNESKISQNRRDEIELLQNLESDLPGQVLTPARENYLNVPEEYLFSQLAPLSTSTKNLQVSILDKSLGIESERNTATSKFANLLNPENSRISMDSRRGGWGGGHGYSRDTNDLISENNLPASMAEYDEDGEVVLGRKSRHVELEGGNMGG
jgi:hypothetical protein